VASGKLNLRKLLRHFLSRLANWLYARPRLKQLALKLVQSVPPNWEDRMRRIVAPQHHLAHGGNIELKFQPQSSKELRARRLLAIAKASYRRSQNSIDKEMPRLAYVSPFPPERTGISNYALMLVPQLSRHYRVELVADQEFIDNDIADHFICHSSQWFEEHGGEFDRILYHMGNAPFHSHMVSLIKKWPGAVMLHDFYLGHLVAHMDNLQPGFLAGELFAESGFPGLLKQQVSTATDIMWQHPLNISVLNHGLGLIVHSSFSITLAQLHYGNVSDQPWQVIPHLKVPAPEISSHQKAAIRKKLNIPENAFVACSFGHLSPTKLHNRLINAWIDSPLSQSHNCYLIMVGENTPSLYGRGLEDSIQQSGLSDRIRITGWTESDEFNQYLACADMAIQLRSQSRGETSGAAIDCLSHGLPTIINAHGTMSDMQRDSVYFLPDEFTDQELISALNELWQDVEKRQQLSRSARLTIAEQHDPERCGDLYKAALESFYQGHNKGLQLARQLVADNPEAPIDRLYQSLADHLDAKLPQKQLLIDVSAIAHSDLKTGVERVVRAQLLELLRSAPEGLRVEPVYLKYHDGDWHYFYARHYACALLGIDHVQLINEKTDVAPGDRLYIPDLNAHSIIKAYENGLFDRLKNKGVSLNVLVHDLLPVTLPECFPPGAATTHEKWLSSISAFADRLICISEAVAASWHQWALDSKLPQSQWPTIIVNPHGSDISASAPSRGMPRDSARVIRRLKAATSFVTVGTIEPRKGHHQILEAFDILWRDGVDINLVIVGKEGWKGLPDSERRGIPDLISKLDWHPERNKRLFWLPGISDQYLEAVYGACNCLLAASFDEGFGLPLIEASGKNLPILARDIRVFREVAAHHATYFSGTEGSVLADAIASWLKAFQKGEIPLSSGIKTLTWEDNVRALINIMYPEDSQSDFRLSQAD